MAASPIDGHVSLHVGPASVEAVAKFGTPGAGKALANAESMALPPRGSWCSRSKKRDERSHSLQDGPLDLSKSLWPTPTPTPTPVAQRRASQRAVLPCGVCGKSFDRPSLLKRHTRTHTGEKPHVCDVCSKGFSTSSSLNTHRRIHSGEKPHECQTCGKRFTASSNLYYHRMTHTKEKPHKCAECDKSFPTPGDLKAHRYIHTGCWPYRCTVCNRGFSKHTNLRNHAFLHTGDRPHPCALCGKKFALACNLRAHTKTHHHDHVTGLTAQAQATQPARVKSPNTINRQFDHGHYQRCERPRVKLEPPDAPPTAATTAAGKQANYADLLATLSLPGDRGPLFDELWPKQLVAYPGHARHCALGVHPQFALLPPRPLLASLSLVELQTMLFVQANMASYFKHGGVFDESKMLHSSQIN